MVRPYKAVVILLSGMGMTTGASAAGALRIGVSDSDAPPIVILSPDNQLLQPSLTKNLLDPLAAELGMKPAYTVIARKRIENALETGKVDIICNANPEWYANASRLGWTREFYPQIERVISLKDVADIRQVDDMAGRRIGTIRGYSYPGLEHLWAAGRTARVDESRLDFLVKSLQKHLTDVAISSELEVAWWAKSNPQEAKLLKQHPVTISYMPTMCAVSPHSTVSVERLNQGIEALKRSGKINAVLKSYAWQAE